MWQVEELDERDQDTVDDVLEFLGQEKCPCLKIENFSKSVDDPEDTLYKFDIVPVNHEDNVSFELLLLSARVNAISVSTLH